MRLSFITQFKIEFLPPLTSCRKVLGKISVFKKTRGSSFKIIISNHLKYTSSLH